MFSCEFWKFFWKNTSGQMLLFQICDKIFFTNDFALFKKLSNLTSTFWDW